MGSVSNRASEACESVNDSETIRYRLINPATRKFNRYASEKKPLTEKLISNINPNRRTTILDIGSGGGYFLDEISKRAGKCVGIEPDPIMARASIRKLSMHQNVQIISKSLETFDYSRKFDAVVASHTLSFFEEKLAMITKMLAFTKAEGMILLVLHSFRSPQYQMLEEFQKRASLNGRPHVSAEVLCTCLKSIGLDPTLELVPSSTLLPSLEAALSLGYFLFRANLRGNRAKFRRTVAISLLANDMLGQRVRIKTIHGIISVTKPS